MFSLKIDDELHLRLLDESDTDELFELVNQNRLYLRQWLPWLDKETSREDSLYFIRSTLDQFANNAGLSAAILLQDRIVGVISYNSIDWNNRIAYIGYWLSAGYQGRGIITRACRRLIGHAFEEFEMHRVEIRCATGNRRSCAIPQRLGFTQEGVVRQVEWLYDHYVDHVIYGLLANEWRALNARSNK